MTMTQGRKTESERAGKEQDKVKHRVQNEHFCANESNIIIKIWIYTITFMCASYSRPRYIYTYISLPIYLY